MGLIRQEERRLEYAARWLEAQHSHGVYVPAACASLAVALRMVVRHGTKEEVLTSGKVKVTIPVHVLGSGVRYVTINEIGAALCTDLVGFDPGVGSLMGTAHMIRIRQLRRCVQEGRRV